MFNLEELCKNAVQASYKLQILEETKKNDTLKYIAEKLISNSAYIIAENAKDVSMAKENGIREGMIDRLSLNEQRINAIAEGLRQIAQLPDPTGEILDRFVRPNGMEITKVRVPMGVIGIIYESRPNVTVDAFGLCFKSGNVSILKGGKEAIHTNIAMVNIIREGLLECNLNPDCIGLITDTSREVTTAFMKMKQYVDVLIPRGGAGLIQAVVDNSTIPVIETGTGNCHIYIDEFADIEKAIPIVVNAKTQRISVCNACESLVIHEKIAPVFLEALKDSFKKKNVEVRGDQKVCSMWTDAIPATDEDFATEYLDYIISMKTVSSIAEAIEHINYYSTKHSEAIITENEERADMFLKQIQSSCVYVNVSTRFTDGFEFGFGAEIGISNQKLHARGPMGLKELTTYKYQIKGNGQIRG